MRINEFLERKPDPNIPVTHVIADARELLRAAYGEIVRLQDLAAPTWPQEQ